jgi:hypothetical protein
VASYFSRETSSLSLRLVSPGLEVINPRILSTQSFINKNKPQSSDQIIEKSQSLSLSYNLQPALPPQPTISKEDKGCAENRIGSEVSTAREEYTISTPIDHQVYKTADSGNREFLESKEYGPDRNYEDPTQVPRGTQGRYRILYKNRVSTTYTEGSMLGIEESCLRLRARK